MNRFALPFLGATVLGLCLATSCGPQYLDPIRAGSGPAGSTGGGPGGSAGGATGDGGVPDGGWPILPSAYLFADDFETGGLVPTDAPAGRWTSETAPAAGGSLGPTSAAAHAGALGLQLVDGDGSTGSLDEGSVSFALSAASSFYVRYWARLNAGATPTGQEIISATPSSAVNGCGLLDVLVNEAAGSVSLAGCDSTSTVTSEGPFPQPIDDGWHLMEASMEGLGTRAGRRRLYVDGRTLSDHASLDLSGLAVTGVTLGEAWASPATFQGTFAFDDFRASSAPMASMLVITAPASVKVNTCVPVDVSLRATPVPGIATVSSPVPFTLGVTGVSDGGFFVDADCGVASSTGTLPADSTGTTTFMLFRQPSTVEVRAQSADFLAPATPITVTP